MMVLAVSALLGAGLRRGLEPQGRRIDRWRRSWFHPERELARLFESVLIVAFVWNFVQRYSLPGWAGLLVFLLWALHLPSDGWDWLRFRRNPSGTRELHQRGFLLLGLGPLWVRAGVAGVAAALYFFIAPLRTSLDRVMGFVIARLDAWFC
jgi:hypothetical protein